MEFPIPMKKFQESVNLICIIADKQNARAPKPSSSHHISQSSPSKNAEVLWGWLNYSICFGFVLLCFVFSHFCLSHPFQSWLQYLHSMPSVTVSTVTEFTYVNSHMCSHTPCYYSLSNANIICTLNPSLGFGRLVTKNET